MTRTETAMNFWERLEQVQAENDVLKHPFYVRWAAGELSRDELAFYAGEYRHAVVALAQATDAAARGAEAPLSAELREHALEEAAHISLWDDFAAAVGGELDRAPLPETSACASAWNGTDDTSLLEHLVATYAIESAQPAISATKLEGLLTHYGVERGSGTAYFELHRERDVEHAAAGRRLIDERLEGADEQLLLTAAERALRGNWKLLDGVERAALNTA